MMPLFSYNPKTMRIFFPLKIITYPQGEYGLDDNNPMEITPAEAVAYEDAILAAIAIEVCPSAVSTNDSSGEDIVICCEVK